MFIFIPGYYIYRNNVVCNIFILFFYVSRVHNNNIISVLYFVDKAFNRNMYEIIYKIISKQIF